MSLATNQNWAEKPSTENRWQIVSKDAIRWDVSQEQRLPHHDHIEMCGRRVSLILSYSVDTRGALCLSRKVLWPTLRLTPTGVRSYLTRVFSDLDIAVRFKIDDEEPEVALIQEITFDGVFRVRYHQVEGMEIERTLFPSQDQPIAHEIWHFANRGSVSRKIEAWYPKRRETDIGIYGEYHISGGLVSNRIHHVPPGQDASFALAFQAHLHDILASPNQLELARTRDLPMRQSWITKISKDLSLETPVQALNTAFHFCKIRTTECVFETKRGLMHSPAGSNYYGGMWANDQGEYVAPFVPFLNDQPATESIINCYAMFAKHMNDGYEPLPSSFEMEGDLVVRSFGDRGDAAMLAHGIGRFSLATGDIEIARQLWPLMVWCLEYCYRHLTDDGVVRSDTDELENRFPAGQTNLHTSSLYYDGLVSAMFLANELEVSPGIGESFARKAETLKDDIEKVFGADIREYHTYRYYEDNTTLRAWIGSPLTVGILERAQGTVAALFSPYLWKGNALATEEGKRDFWDRSALYALRGAFVAGATEEALVKLVDYTEQRLLGEHVPYPVEAFPEGNGSQMAAESALYTRIFIEGLFGIRPTGLRSFSWNPHLPQDWPRMALRNIRAFKRTFDLEVERIGSSVECRVLENGAILFSQIATEGKASTFLFTF